MVVNVVVGIGAYVVEVVVVAIYVVSYGVYCVRTVTSSSKYVVSD